MNFLAHSYLSYEIPGLVAGNYLGDILKNKEVTALPVSLQEGVQLHRQIDSYADNHQVFRQGTRILHPHLGKYAPVVLDIYFDYFLSKHWSSFHPLALSDFSQVIYEVLTAHIAFMPQKVGDRLRGMVKGRWLESYQHPPGLRKTFHFLARRAKFPSRLGEATDILQAHEDQLEQVFLGFFPKLATYAQTQVEAMGYPSK